MDGRDQAGIGAATARAPASAGAADTAGTAGSRRAATARCASLRATASDGDRKRLIGAQIIKWLSLVGAILLLDRWPRALAGKERSGKLCGIAPLLHGVE